jgi:hypothetical protein
MTWAKLADTFHSHPKTLAMGYGAAGLYAVGLSYAAAHLTDGFLPLEWVRNATQRERKSSRYVSRLLQVGAWETVANPPGYRIVDFLDYNASREEISRNRKMQNDRVTRYRDRRRNALVTPSIGPDPLKDPLRAPLKDVLALDVDLSLDLPREVSDYVAELRDRNEQTEPVLIALRRELPEAAFRNAMESLKNRRKQKPPLVSETRYFVAALKAMQRDGRYGA